MFTRESAIEHVKAFVTEVRAAGVPLRRAILFGSFARNEQHEWSDIDVALVADTFDGGPTELHPMAAALWKYVPIEPHTFQTEYFEDGDPFIEEIKRTGIVVV